MSNEKIPRSNCDCEGEKYSIARNGKECYKCIKIAKYLIPLDTTGLGVMYFKMNDEYKNLYKIYNGKKLEQQQKLFIMKNYLLNFELIDEINKGLKYSFY